MIDRDHKLPVKRQAQLLDISRGSAYYRLRPVSERDLVLMRQIDEQHLEHLFASSRLLSGLLQREGHRVGRLHIGTLMARMGIDLHLPDPVTVVAAVQDQKRVSLLRADAPKLLSSRRG